MLKYYTLYQYTTKQGKSVVSVVYSLDVGQFLKEYPDAVALKAG